MDVHLSRSVVFSRLPFDGAGRSYSWGVRLVPDEDHLSAGTVRAQRLGAGHPATHDDNCLPGAHVPPAESCCGAAFVAMSLEHFRSAARGWAVVIAAMRPLPRRTSSMGRANG